MFASAPLLPKFEGAGMYHELRKRGTRLRLAATPLTRIPSLRCASLGIRPLPQGERWSKRLARARTNQSAAQGQKAGHHRQCDEEHATARDPAYSLPRPRAHFALNELLAAAHLAVGLD